MLVVYEFIAFDERAAVLAAALVIDAVIGDPDWLWRRLPHPVVVFGWCIGGLEKMFNRRGWRGVLRRWLGVAVIAVLAVLGAFLGVMLASWGLWFEVLVVAILLAGRGLDQHVRAVATALASGNLIAARQAVARIVGRNPDNLDAPAIARASIESTAENLADGVVAPAFYYLLLGLPGIIAYKIINTADSMIGHKSARFLAFGWGAARLDDVANLIPARLSGVLLALASIPRTRQALGVMWRDAAKHRSPNAGYPEAAMAGALDVRLAGPRQYGIRFSTDAPINAQGRDADTDDIRQALRYFWRLVALMAGLCALMAWLV